MSKRPQKRTVQGLLASWEVDRLRLMKAKGLKAPEMAAYLGVSVRTVYRYLGPDRYCCRHCGATFATSALAWEHMTDGPTA